MTSLNVYGYDKYDLTENLEALRPFVGADKFVDADIDPTAYYSNDLVGMNRWVNLFQCAHAYVTNYNGTFDYMVDMRKRDSSLTIPMLRGVLNCMRAELSRMDKFKDTNSADTIATEDTISGRYAIDLNGKLGFFKVDVVTEGKWAGWTFVKRIIGGGRGSDNLVPVKGSERSTVLNTIGSDPQGAMLRYGQEIGICGVCSRDLTDESSRAKGIGPICSENLGW